MHDEDHGHSPAAWTGTAVMLLAAAVACYAAVFGPVELMWGGVVVFLLGALGWYAMAKAGIGSADRHAGS
ncbi:HGxxPAAW family protein [Ornithinimicrobium pekingense]|uniref:Uncharacterized protein n=1 Tax=Ornithinimicrobium pekingense TaxID=384677 RepID=A0ABQ2FAX2_9MICO|nr:HGxxPAAW family protein [Ornithinimicrobium pekingense]GGK74432.1 hypothetical protein GCM10011509_23800 [Ornithinimicrobium pekingense]